MTLSCLSSKGLQTDTKIMPTNLSAETNLFGLFEHYLTWIYPEETKYRYKLELGPVQTLAHKDENGNWILNDPPPNKALELAKCQRYFRVISPEYSIPVVSSYSNNRHIVVSIPGMPMRTTPSVSLWGWGPDNVVILNEGMDVRISNTGAVGINPHLIRLETMTEIQVRAVYAMHLNNAIWLSADL